MFFQYVKHYILKKSKLADRNAAKLAGFTPSQLDPHVCAQINYEFGILDMITSKIMMEHELDPQLMVHDIDSSSNNTGLEKMITLSGWKDLLGHKNGEFVTDETNRKTFIINAIEFLKKYGFNGLDLYWEAS